MVLKLNLVGISNIREIELNKIPMITIVVLPLFTLLTYGSESTNVSNNAPSGGFNCSKSVIQTDTLSNTTTLENTDYGFKVKFPSKWFGDISSCVPSIEDMSYIPMSVVTNLTSTNTIDDRGFVWIIIALNNKATLQQQLESKKSLGILLNLTNQEMTQFNGMSAFKETYDLGFGKMETVNFINHDNFFVIEYPVLNGSAGVTIQNIVNSFEIMNPVKSNDTIDESLEFG